MAEFAKLHANGTVLQVIVVNDDIALTEEIGVEFLTNLLGHSRWKQCHKDGRRRRFPGPGFKYDEANNAFIPPKPFPSWRARADGEWEPPTPKPNDGKKYRWDEPSQSWVELPARP